MLKNLKIRGKLIVCFGVVIALFIATVITSLVALNTARNNFEAFHEDAFKISNRTYTMRVQMNSTSKNICNAMMTLEPDQVENYISQAQDTLTQLKENLVYIEENVPAIAADAAEIRSLLEGSVKVKEQIYEYSRLFMNDEAQALYFDVYEPTLLQAQEMVIGLDTYTEKYAEEIYDHSMSVINVISMVLIGLSIAALIITVIVCLRLTAMLTRPIYEIESAAEELLHGNLKAVDVLTYDSRDELGEIQDSLRQALVILDGYVDEISAILEQMAKGDLTISWKEITEYRGNFGTIRDSFVTILKDFNMTLAQIAQSSSQLDASSDHIASSSQLLAQGTTEQAASLQDLNGTVGKISEQIRHNADNAVEANNLTTKVKEEVNESINKMNEMNSAMRDIQQKSQEIEKIIKTIEDIAFQTNILALNAAVEAARAGDAGKGFAVVADEVRNLAGKSAEASQNTAALIVASVEAVGKGMVIANETSQSLDLVNETTNDVVDRVNEIAMESEEQALAVGEITELVSQISAVVESTAATTEQTSAASEELASQATHLNDMIGNFSLYEG